MRIRLGFLLLAILCFPAFGVPRFEVMRVDGKQKTPFNANPTVRWKWVLNSEKVTVLTMELKLQSPEFTKFTKMATLSKSTRFALKGDTVTLQLGGLTDKILLKSGDDKAAGETPENAEIPADGVSGGSGQKLFLELNGQGDEGLIIDNQCRRLDIALKPTGEKPPFYLGTACGATADGGVSFTLIFPDEVNVDQSSLFDAKGKGEPWRYYELGNIKGASGALGRFQLSYKGKSYPFTLESISAGAQKAKTEEQANRILFAVGAGFSSLKITGADITASSGKPSLFLRVPHYPVVGGFGVGMDTDIALALSQSVDSISFIQFDIFASYEFVLGSTFMIRPKVGYLVTQQTHSGTQIAIAANEMEVGANFEWRFTPEFRGVLGVTKCGFGSAVTKSHMAITLGVFRKVPKEMGWGIGAKLQSFTAVSELGIERNFGQTGFYALLAF